MVKTHVTLKHSFQTNISSLPIQGVGELGNVSTFWARVEVEVLGDGRIVWSEVLLWPGSPGTWNLVSSPCSQNWVNSQP